MSEQDVTDNELRLALHEVSAGWLAKSQEADKKRQHLSVANVQQALYQRGIAEGLRLAIADIKQLLATGEEIPEQPTEDVYPFVTREIALSVLGKIGLHITELHQHEDNTFSAIFPPLQALNFEERIHKLNDIADVDILAKGQLPASNKAYIDFAFRKLPTS